MKYCSAIALFVFVISFSFCTPEREGDVIISSPRPTGVIEGNTKVLTNTTESVDLPAMWLNEGRVITITYTSIGCFHYYKQNIRVKKVNDEIYAASFDGMGEAADTGVIYKKMDKRFQQSLIDFGENCRSLLLKEKKDSLKQKVRFSTTTSSLSVNDRLYFVDIILDNDDYSNPLSGLLFWMSYYGKGNEDKII